MAIVLSGYHHTIFIFLVLPIVVLNIPICSSPYECLTSTQCARKLSATAAEKVLFRCADMERVCCPGRLSSRTPPVIPHTTELITNSHTSPRHHVHNHRQPSNTARSNDTSPGNRRETFLPKKSGSSTANNLTSHVNFPLLPSNCGISQYLLPDKITEGVEVDLGEYPWMALIGIKDEGRVKYWPCGGTLINHRYVLSAAHCVLQRNGTEYVVRLGEHDLKTRIDCDKMKNICLDPPLDFRVEEIVVHERWNTRTLKNDIALLRLSNEVSESSGLTPICLPLNMPLRNVSEKIKFEIAGWGKTEWNAEVGSSVLLKGTLSYVPNKDCHICTGPGKEDYCPLTENQVCTQGWKFVDVCKGDSGGPLMYYNNKMYQVGITSFKSSEYCGGQNIPSIFTRLENYLPWILNNIRA